MATTPTAALSPDQQERRSRSIAYWHWLPEKEAEQRWQVAEALRSAYSSMSWHAERAARDPDYWNSFTASRPFWSATTDSWANAPHNDPAVRPLTNAELRQMREEFSASAAWMDEELSGPCRTNVDFNSPQE